MKTSGLRGRWDGREPEGVLEEATAAMEEKEEDEGKGGDEREDAKGAVCRRTLLCVPHSGVISKPVFGKAAKAMRLLCVGRCGDQSEV